MVFNNSFRKEVDFTLDIFEIKIVAENVSYFQKAPPKICESNPFFTGLSKNLNSHMLQNSCRLFDKVRTF